MDVTGPGTGEYKVLQYTLLMTTKCQAQVQTPI